MVTRPLDTEYGTQLVQTLAETGTSLIGREEEISAIRTLIDAGQYRLVTLVGPGGIGKTRLALAVAASLSDDFAHGAHVVSLAPVRVAELVPGAVLRSMGVSPSGAVPDSEMLASLLRERHLLLVLDNVEQLVDGVASWLADLLARCPRLQVVATSRMAIRITGEQQFPVEPLGVPEADHEITAERVQESAAARLFVERACAVRPDIAFDDASASDVAGICRAVDGVPLAIELAAARVGMLSLPALRARLTNRLALLTRGQRDAPSRHRTMASAIGWSYDLLTEPERRLFRRLAVFTGGFTFEAAEAMGANAGTEAGVVDAFTTLVEHSLVRRLSSARDDDRYGMLQTFREFGVERLADAGEDVDARDTHAGYFLRLVATLEQSVREAAPAGRGAAQVAILDRIEVERDNLRAVMAWLTERERIEEALALAVAIWPFHGSRGHDVEARTTLETLLAHPRAADRTLERAHALGVVGNYARSQADMDRAVDACQEALAIYTERGEHGYAARGLMALGWATMDTGRLDEALAYYDESLRLARSVGDLDCVASALDMMGLALLEQNDHAAARERFEEAQATCMMTGERARLGNILGHLGILTMRDGDTALAISLFEESIAIGREVGDHHLLPMDFVHLADIYWRGGDPVSANDLLQEILAITRRTGYAGGELLTHAGLAALAFADGDVGSSIRHLQEGVVAGQRAGLRSGLQCGCEWIFDGLAGVALAIDDLPAAMRFHGMADGLFDRIGVPRPHGDPPFMEPSCIEAIRSKLNDPAMRAEWEAGFALEDDAMVAEALVYAPPETAIAPSNIAAVPEAAKDLSPRELEVLRLMADGLTNREVAAALFISLRTAASHASTIIGKLGVHTRTAAVAYAIRNGLA